MGSKPTSRIRRAANILRVLVVAAVDEARACGAGVAWRGYVEQDFTRDSAECGDDVSLSISCQRFCQPDDVLAMTSLVSAAFLASTQLTMTLPDRSPAV